MPEIEMESDSHQEYQHFIPRFILRNFAHRTDTTSPPTKKRRRGRKKNLEKPDLLHTVQINPSVELANASANREFGQFNLYDQNCDGLEKREIETALSGLESKAAKIIDKFTKGQEKKQATVTLRRDELDTLRKFLFIMKYRGSIQRRRFYDDDNNTIRDGKTYASNDGDAMAEYMRRKGFSKPIQVWYNNIKTILNMDMDMDNKWVEELEKSMYPPDARWAVANIQCMYLAFCTPEHSDDEFILTENAYGIHEGPVSYSVNTATGEEKMTAYTEYHNFAPISPKLMIVLRNTLLPNAEEDAALDVREMKELLRHLKCRFFHNDYDMTNSFLEHLPVTKARNSYTNFVDGKFTLKTGETRKIGCRRAYDEFYFHFFHLSSDYTQKINSILLNEAYNTSKFVFNSETGAQRALRHYLTDPCCEEGAYPLKLIPSPNDPKKLFLDKLEQAARLLGYQTDAKFDVEISGWINATCPDIPRHVRTPAFDQTVAESLQPKAAFKRQKENECNKGIQQEAELPLQAKSLSFQEPVRERVMARVAQKAQDTLTEKRQHLDSNTTLTSRSDESHDRELRTESNIRSRRIALASETQPSHLQNQQYLVKKFSRRAHSDDSLLEVPKLKQNGLGALVRLSNHKGQERPRTTENKHPTGFTENEEQMMQIVGFVILIIGFIVLIIGTIIGFILLILASAAWLILAYAPWLLAAPLIWRLSRRLALFTVQFEGKVALPKSPFEENWTLGKRTTSPKENSTLADEDDPSLTRTPELLRGQRIFVLSIRWSLVIFCLLAMVDRLWLRPLVCFMRDETSLVLGRTLASHGGCFVSFLGGLLLLVQGLFICQCGRR